MKKEFKQKIIKLDKNYFITKLELVTFHDLNNKLIFFLYMFLYTNNQSNIINFNF